MKYVLPWVMMSMNGTVSSGSAEFEDQAACATGAAEMEILAVKASASGMGIAGVRTRCTPIGSK